MRNYEIDASFFDEHSIFNAVLIAGYKDIGEEQELMYEMTRTIRPDYDYMTESDYEDESSQRYIDTDKDDNYIDDDDDELIDLIDNQ